MHAILAAGGGLPDGQGLKQLGELGLAFALSSVVGLEREWRQKSAGLRTHTLVGFGAALILLVSKYGFGDVINGSSVVLDPSRIAAQIVSGLGFIGGGLIFVRGDIVRGLTTAATVWFTAAVGMACGAGLAVLALVATGGYLVTALVYRVLAERLPRAAEAMFALRVVYEDGRGILRDVLAACTDRGFTIARVTTQSLEGTIGERPAVAVTLEVGADPGHRRAEELVAAVDEISGVHEVTTREVEEADA